MLLEASRALHQTHRAAAQDFLRLSSPGSASPASVISDATLLGLVSWHTYDPILGSLDSAVASGRLSLIRDSRLRVALAGWVDSVEDLVEQEVVDRDHAQRFADIAFEFIPYRSAVFRMGGQESVGRLSTAEADHRGLLESLKAENVAANRVAEIGFILDDLARVQSELEVILGLLPS